MVSWGPDDGKSILKRCIGTETRDRQTSKVATEGVDIQQERSIRQAGKKTQIRSKYPTHF